MIIEKNENITLSVLGFHFTFPVSRIRSSHFTALHLATPAGGMAHKLDIAVH